MTEPDQEAGTAPSTDTTVEQTRANVDSHQGSTREQSGKDKDRMAKLLASTKGIAAARSKAVLEEKSDADSTGAVRRQGHTKRDHEPEDCEKDEEGEKTPDNITYLLDEEEDQEEEVNLKKGTKRAATPLGRDNVEEGEDLPTNKKNKRAVTVLETDEENEEVVPKKKGKKRAATELGTDEEDVEVVPKKKGKKRAATVLETDEEEVVEIAAKKGTRGPTKRMLEDGSEAEQAQSKRRRMHEGTESTSTDSGLRVAGMGLLKDGTYALVYEKVTSAFRAKPSQKREPVDVDLYTTDNDDNPQFNGGKQPAPQGKQSTVSNWDVSSKTKLSATMKDRRIESPPTVKKVSAGKQSSIHSSTSRETGTTGSTLVHAETKTAAPVISMLERRILREAIPLWQLYQACMELYPTQSQSERWAQSALDGAANRIIQEGGESAKNVEKLLAKRKNPILREIESHSEELLSSIVKLASKEVPVCFQGVLRGGSDAIAWRVRRLLDKFNFIYDGYEWATDARTLKKAAFLSPCLIAVMSGIWKDAVEEDVELFERMPLRVIAAASLGVWAFLKTWWTGDCTAFAEAFPTGELEKTYVTIVSHLEAFEERKPQVFEEMQREVSARVKRYGMVENTGAGNLFLDGLDDDE
ncbi:hypothetical protein CALCODRAFT_488934 [Calocera cornea HHB12733]|uniref:DUF6532 domain-containing protein n=1 Tax=Calocera cornea HHB12733 TaxID=1353952 RepID=A0A165C231_9BASI|nr:hypothetical protein CALCODRAFT_488934 [Calocera cornea HHB12733]